jgi:hypothetical protein
VRPAQQVNPVASVNPVDGQAPRRKRINRFGGKAQPREARKIQVGAVVDIQDDKMSLKKIAENVVQPFFVKIITNVYLGKE